MEVLPYRRVLGQQGPMEMVQKWFRLGLGHRVRLGRAKAIQRTTRGGRHSLPRFVLSFNDS